MQIGDSICEFSNGFIHQIHPLYWIYRSVFIREMSVLRRLACTIVWLEVYIQEKVTFVKEYLRNILKTVMLCMCMSSSMKHHMELKII